MTSKGAMYKPSPPPQTNDPYAIRQWCEREFNRIADAQYENRGIWVRLDENAEMPPKPAAGMVVYFAANVVGPGLAQGLYEYAAGAWKKL